MILTLFLIGGIFSLTSFSEAGFFEKTDGPQDESDIIHPGNNSAVGGNNKTALQNAKDTGLSLITSPITGVLELFRQVSAFLLKTAWAVLEYVLSPTIFDKTFFNEGNKKVLNEAWGFVRDFVNLFYILILIFLAIANILRIGKYSDKKLFISVLFSALLVNFSMALTWVVIDASNIAMVFFMEQTKNASIGAQTMGSVGMEHVYEGYSNFKSVSWGMTNQFFEIIVYLIMAIMVFFLAVNLIIRMVAFWVLLILSPLAFFSLALPGGALGGMFSNWSKKLFNYAFYGPVLVFFLYLAMHLLNALKASNFDVGDNIASMVIPYVVTIYLLFYGHDLASSMGKAAGSMTGQIFDKSGQWMNKGKKYGAYAGTLGLAPLAVGAYNQRVKPFFGGTGERVKKAFGQDKDKIADREAQARARGEGGDSLEKWERTKADEIKGKIEKQGVVDKAAAMAKLSSAKGADAKAWAMYAAEKGYISNGSEYDRVTQGLGGDRQLLNKARKEIQKNFEQDSKDGKIKNSAQLGGIADVLGRTEFRDGDGKAVSLERVNKEIAKSNSAMVLENEAARLSAALQSGDAAAIQFELNNNAGAKSYLEQRGLADATDQAKTQALGGIRTVQDMEEAVYSKVSVGDLLKQKADPRGTIVDALAAKYRSADADVRKGIKVQIGINAGGNVGQGIKARAAEFL